MAGKAEKQAPRTEGEGKDQALQDALADIEKRYGRGAIMKLGDARDFKVDVISTGSLALDLALGVGGLPRGRITEIYGPEGAGKSTLAYHVVASAQRLGGVAAYIDVEHALDKDHAESCGIDVSELLISQPDTGEQALEICDALVRSNAVDVIVVDSVAALVPRAEIEGEMGDSHASCRRRCASSPPSSRSRARSSSSSTSSARRSASSSATRR
jgi:recombination protein RecA